MSASTQRRIERAALVLFAQKGFAATGIRELADAAGLSTATLYHYMGAKEELLHTIVEQTAERLLNGGKQILDDVPRDPAARLAALVQLHTIFHARQPMETTVLATELRALPSRERRQVTALQTEYEELWSAALTAGADDAVISISDVRVARLALTDMASGVARWYSPRGPTPLAEVIVQLTDLALAAIRATDAAGALASAERLGLADDSWITHLRQLEARVSAETVISRPSRR